MRVLLWIDCQLTIGWSQCGQVKALSTKLQKVKVYASSVHGLNLLFHRFLPTGTGWSARHCAGIKGTQPAILWQLCFQRARAQAESTFRGDCELRCGSFAWSM